VQHGLTSYLSAGFSSLLSILLYIPHFVPVDSIVKGVQGNPPAGVPGVSPGFLSPLAPEGGVPKTYT
jgi:hypothetical protein